MTKPSDQPHCAANSVAFVRFAAPDLEVLKRFLLDFGLTPAVGGSEVAFYRGAASTPYVYVAKRGPQAFGGVAFGLPDRAALGVFSRTWGSPIEELDGPGAGLSVRLRDPDGISVEAVVFREPAEPLTLRPSLQVNTADATPRLAQERRLSLKGPQVCRLGHVVLQVTNLARSEAWYKARFGFLTSDEIRAEAASSPFAVFLRFDEGETFTDHHSLFLLEAESAGFHHAAFEVRDLDDLMVGHDRLKSSGYSHHFGVGRHYLGGQVFDYWRDPYGNVLEHWTDGDKFNATAKPRISSTADLQRDAWRSVEPEGAASADSHAGAAPRRT